jgi:hypothetical protein
MQQHDADNQTASPIETLRSTDSLSVVGGEFPGWNSGTLPRGTLLD